MERGSYMMREIVGFEGLYSVTDDGKVWSERRNKFLATAISLKGYEHLTLHKDGERTNKMVHILVAEAFVDNPDGKPQVNHLDENKLNNKAENLEWVTPKENSNYGTRTERIISQKRISVYCNETDVVYESIADAARKTGINVSTIVNNLKLPNEKKRKWHFSLA